jgi:hypothetical protein
MKALTIILLTLFMAKGCSKEAKNDLANAEIVYTANTRGFYQKITIQNHEVFVNATRGDEGKGDANAISDADWNELVSDFETITLDSLATYKAPTKKRFYDGAAIANLKVTYKEKEYQTLDFDYGFPPVEIEKLANKIVVLGQKE